MAGLHAYAVHLPRLLVRSEAYAQAGRAAPRCEAKRVPSHDEDEATLAIAAGRALRGLGGPEPALLLTASLGAEPFGALLAEALGLGAARIAEHRGPLAGLAALREARDALQAGAGAAMVVSADAPALGPDDEREPAAGAAATAWLLTLKGPVQLRREAHAALAGVGGAVRDAEALGKALAGLTRSGLHADGVAHAALPDLDRGLAAVAQRALPKAKLAQPGQQVGDAGATAPLLGLARALEDARPGDAVVLAGAGAGLAAALSLEVEAAPAAATLAAQLAAPAETLDHPRLARLRGWLGQPAPDVSQGAAVSEAQYLATLPARLRLEGQRCAACGVATFPPREACAACGAARLEPLRLGGAGVVHSVATIGRGSAPAEFAEQQRRAGAYDVAIVELAEGPRVAAQVCDAAPGALRIGDPVELVVRRLYRQNGAPRYGFKARALRGPGGSSRA